MSLYGQYPIHSPRRVGDLPRSERESLLRQLASRSGQFIETLGFFLDTPGAIARGVLAGEPLSGFSMDPETRVTGEELLSEYGVRPRGTLAKFGSGLATEIVTDPLAFVSGPLTALTKGGRAARAAGLLDDATRVASARAASRATRTARYTAGDIAKSGLQLTEGVTSARPLVGPRYAQATTTLDELVQASPDPSNALRNVEAYLGGSGEYAKYANEKLGGLLGIGPPLGESTRVLNPFGQKGTEAIADVLDLAGQRIGWSAPGRFASSMFDQRVGGQTDTAGQITAIRRHQLVDAAVQQGNRQAAVHALKLSQMRVPDAVAQRTGVPDLFSKEGNAALTRYLEGLNARTAVDIDLVHNTPGLRQWADEWDVYRTQAQQSARQMGLPANDLSDPFGIEYLPRHADELTQEALDRAVPKTAAYSARTSDMMGRVDALKVPGGTDSLRRISLDPRVREYAALQRSSPMDDEAIGRHIQTLVPVSHEKATRIARIMRGLDPDLPKDMPIFGSHPLTNTVRYMIGREKAEATAESLYEALTDAAVQQVYTQVPGGGHYSLKEAIDIVAGKTGLEMNGSMAGANVTSQMRDRLARKFGVSPDSVMLSQLSVPKETIERLTRLNDFYTQPAAQGEILRLFDQYTRLFKGFVLAWPSRYVRDLYSGAFSNYLETGNVSDVLAGTAAAAKVLEGKYDDVRDFILRIPRYSGMNPQQAIAEFLVDAGASGALRGLSTSDLLTANQTGQTLSQLIPGQRPLTAVGPLEEFASQPGRTWGEFGRRFAQIKGVTDNIETGNPILRWGERMNDYTDSVNRLGGYMALMKQGLAPEQAAKRVLASQVDYSSLTPFERGTIRSVFPWWAYTSRIGKYVVENLMQRPGGRYGQTIRAINTTQRGDEQTYIPTALRQRFAIGIPDDLSQFFGAENRTYLTDIDLPGIDVLNLIKPAYQPDPWKAVLQTGTDSLGEVVQQGHPLIRTAAELATGRDFFTKRPLDEAYTPLDRAYQAVTGSREKLDPAIQALIKNIPGTQRIASLTGALLDQRLPVPARLAKATLNNLSGIKIQNVDPEYELLDAREKIARQLEPYNRTFTQAYIPEELLPYVPLESQRMNALDRELQRELRRRWEKG